MESAELIASSFVRTFVLPPAGLFLMALAACSIRGRFPRTGGALALGSIVALFALSTELVAGLLVRPLEGLTAPLSDNDRGRAQAIVVLAAGRVEDAPEYQSRNIPDYVALGRMRYAAHLHHESGLPILVSGGNVEDGGSSKAEDMARALTEDFRAPVRWIEGESQNTAENGRYSARILEPAGITRVLLVTDAMHMPRAHKAFAASGLEVIEAPTMFMGPLPLSVRGLVPSVEGLRRSSYAIHEWIGLLWYRVRYRSYPDASAKRAASRS